jgi:hypothetical protein
MDQSELDLAKAKLELSQFETKRRLMEEAQGQGFKALEISLLVLVVIQFAVITADQMKFGRTPSVWAIFIVVMVLMTCMNIRTQRRLDALVKLISSKN